MSEHAGALGQAGAATSSLQTLTLLPAVLARLGPKVDKIARCPLDRGGRALSSPNPMAPARWA